MIAAAFVSLCTMPALGQSTWTGNTNEFWGVGSNWNPAGVPAATADLTFDGTATLFLVDLGAADRMANTITINSATSYLFEDNNPGQTLTPGDVSVFSGTGHQFDLPIALGTGATYSIFSGSDLSISGIVSGTGALTKMSPVPSLSPASTHTAAVRCSTTA